MKIASLKLQTSHLTANEEALVRCQAALELKDRGDYEGARNAMGALWVPIGEQPKMSQLHSSVAAEVLLAVGILTRCVGSKNEIKEAQGIAKNLISQSLTLYQSIGDIKKVAIARTELAYCYWREGALNEARVMFREALQKLTTEGNSRANAVLGLAVVEWTASRNSDALKLLTESDSLFKKITNHSIKGAYHSQLAIVLRNLATAESREDYFQQAITEYQTADHEFKLAHSVVFRADVKNNVGLLLYKRTRYKEAHKYLGEARRLAVSIRDKVRTAQYDDTRAQILIAERRFKEAETIGRNTVRILEKTGQQCLLADALITQGIALARLKKVEHSQFTFQKAIEVAHQVGALNKAGLAALTMIEELESLAPETLWAAYDRASEWLASSQSPDLLLRLNAVGRRVVTKLRLEPETEKASVTDTIEALLNKPCDLPREVLKFEGSVIRQALAQANGSLTRAAALLSMSYQALAYILDSRHKELLTARSPIRRRSRKDAPA
jgi:tetratricopeptide (TPR) repeat protein